MTVIAYRDGVLACDSETQDQNRRIGTLRKIGRAPNGLIAGSCGRSGVCARFLAWIEAEMPGSFDPKAEHGYFGALLIDRKGVVRHMDAEGNLTFIKASFFADGAGDQIAIGAMEMGASAEQAVQAAIKWSPSCGGPVQIERLAVSTYST